MCVLGPWPSYAPSAISGSAARTVSRPWSTARLKLRACDLLSGELHADVAVEHLAVIADSVLDDPVHPVLRQPELLAEIPVHPEHPLDLRIARLELLVHVRLADPVLLGDQHRVVRPLDDVEPLRVALPHKRRQRLLGDDLRQHDVVASGLGELEPCRVEARRIGRIGVAADYRLVGVERFLERQERHALELHLVGAEIVREVELGRRALLHAHGRAVELTRRLDLELLGHDEALAIVIVDGRALEAELRLARGRPGGIAGEHVDVARLQRREAVLGGERDELYLVRIVEDRGRDRAAEVDVEPGPGALRIRQAEARQLPVRAAIDHAALLHLVERARHRGACECRKGARHRTHSQKPTHATPPPECRSRLPLLSRQLLSGISKRLPRAVKRITRADTLCLGSRAIASHARGLSSHARSDRMARIRASAMPWSRSRRRRDAFACTLIRVREMHAAPFGSAPAELANMSLHPRPATRSAAT